MPKRGRNRKKSRTQQTSGSNADAAGVAAPPSTSQAEALASKVPKSLVLRRGKTALEVGTLVEDLRQLLLPYTAVHFQDDPKNRKLTLAQYCQHLALPMGITHMLAFSQNHQRLNLRLARTPAGPTLHFRIHQFSLNRHIKQLQKRPVSYTSSLTANPPVVVTNNFGDASAAPPHVKLMRITFQNMFPAINVATVKLAECRRVVLFNFMEQEVEEDDEEEATTGDAAADDDDDDNNKATEKNDTSTTKRTRIRQMVEMRHYAIKATPVGVHRRVRRLQQVNKKLPNLHKCQDIADYLTGNAGAALSDAPSDSEPEDDDANVVQLPDHYVGQGNHRQQRSALKLVEIGPRLSMELIKVEKGLSGGDVLYHAHVTKTPEEAAALKLKAEQAVQLKQQRRAQQEANVERKRQAAAEKRETKRRKRAERDAAAMAALRNETASEQQQAAAAAGGEDGSEDGSSGDES